MRRTAATLTALMLVFAGAAGGRAEAGEPWRAPVPGAVTRGFEPGRPYEGGHHRGADFAAPSGSAVRAACAGRVVVARRVGSSGRLVTVRCGDWRVSVLPLATIAVREGATVASGARIGTAAAVAAHAGLHLGVRREGRRFGYADPLRFLTTGPSAPPLLGPRPTARRGPRTGHPPATRPRMQQAPATTGSNPHSLARPPLAPWPAWLGLALLLAGAAGAGVRRAAASRSPAARVRAVSNRIVERVR